MYDKAVDAFLPASEFVPGWIVINKMAEKLDNPVISNDDIFFVDVYSSIITFRSNDKGFETIDLNILTLMIIVLIKKILKLVFMLDLWLGVIDLNNIKHVKKK